MTPTISSAPADLPGGPNTKVRTLKMTLQTSLTTEAGRLTLEPYKLEGCVLFHQMNARGQWHGQSVPLSRRAELDDFQNRRLEAR